MSREILIHVQKGERQVAITKNSTLDDFFIETDHHMSILGNIYKGKIESILPSINAAFVNIGEEKNGFLYLTDVVDPVEETDPFGERSLIDKLLRRSSQEKRKRQRRKTNKDDIPFKVGQEIIVQVVKDPFSGKGARLTTHISIPWRFIVYMPFDRQAGVSRKITDPEERARLKDVLDSFDFSKAGGFIIRTAALKQDKKELLRDAKSLYRLWQKIYKKYQESKAPVCLYKEGELIWRVVRDYLNEEVDAVVIDSEDDYVQIRKFVQTLIGRKMVSKIQPYEGQKSLFETKGVAKQLKTIYDTNVYTKSGAYVVIEQTEAFSVVDVNSGKFKVKASPGDAAFMVNMEVIPDIARQLRLRDLGGIIVIDFIDMLKEEHKRKVIDYLQRELSRDYAKTEVNKISALGLVEMTRERTGKNIESMSFKQCSYCHGRGKIKIG